MNSDDCVLASTGAEFVGPISLALLLLVVGAVIVVSVRRGRGAVGPLALVALLAVTVFSLSSPARAYADDDCDESTATPTATVTATPTSSATAAPTGSATATVTPTTGAIDLGLGGVVSATDPNVGAEFTYTLTLTNEAAVASETGVRVFVPAVAGVTNSDFAGAGWSLVSQDADGAIYEYSAVVAGGGSAEPLVLTLTPTAAGDYTLEANIVTGTGGDTVTSNNTTSASITAAVAVAPDLQVKVTASITPVYISNTTLQTTYRVRNVGTLATSGTTTVTIQNMSVSGDTWFGPYAPNFATTADLQFLQPPAGWTLVSSSATSYTYTTTNSLAVGESVDFVMQYYTDALPAGSNAFVGTASTLGDSDSSNDSGQVVVPVVRQ